jgi:hypothetical protein
VTTMQVIEVVAGIAIIAAGIWLYRKGAREDAQHGSQGAVLLFVVAALLLIHGLGLMEYRPSAAELGQ